jgi:hypothetical protein
MANGIRRFWCLAVVLILGFGTRCAGGSYSIRVDLREQQAYLLENGHIILQSPISSGRYGHLTPAGRYHVLVKDLNHVSSIYGRIVNQAGATVVLDANSGMRTQRGTHFVNAPMHYFMEFRPGFGLHAGYLPGYPASHGCVRMPEQDAITFFRAVSVGTPVTIVGTTPRNQQPQTQVLQARPVQTPSPKPRFLFGLFRF